MIFLNKKKQNRGGFLLNIPRAEFGPIGKNKGTGPVLNLWPLDPNGI